MPNPDPKTWLPIYRRAIAAGHADGYVDGYAAGYRESQQHTGETSLSGANPEKPDTTPPPPEPRG